MNKSITSDPHIPLTSGRYDDGTLNKLFQNKEEKTHLISYEFCV